MGISICKISDYFPRYRQLLLPIETGISHTDKYKKVALQGQMPTDLKISFNQEEIRKCTCDTPAGEAEILLVSDRDDFEHIYRALAYKCEPEHIPSSVGAATIRGVINWEKIISHKMKYLAQGGTDWKEEFRRFTADKNRYLDSIILLSSGPYSSISSKQIGMEEKEWEEKSITIRMYHELMHFICRKLYPDKKDIIRDEIYADCIGIIAAFGEYDPKLAKLFIGIETETYRKGARLEHYSTENMEEDILKARLWIEEVETKVFRAWHPEKWETIPESDRDEALFELIRKIYGE